MAVLANEMISLFPDGDRITCLAGGAITGKRFVAVSATRDASTGLIVVTLCGAGLKALGVSGYDAPSGGQFPVHMKPRSVVPITAGAAIAAGDEVQSDATGRAITVAAGRALGQAVEVASGAGVDVFISLY